jgi:hypothetical protein
MTAPVTLAQPSEGVNSHAVAGRDRVQRTRRSPRAFSPLRSSQHRLVRVYRSTQIWETQISPSKRGKAAPPDGRVGPAKFMTAGFAATMETPRASHR